MELSSDFVWSGKYFYKSRPISSHTNNVLDRFAEIKSETERIQFIFEILKIKDPFENVEVFRKSARLSTQFRTQGNGYYKEKKFTEALRAYNLAICFSPLESPEFFLAIANRSAIYFEQREYKLCQSDVNLVLQCSINTHEITLLKTKLQSRMERCIKESLLNENESTNNNSPTSSSPPLKPNYFELKNRNSAITSAEDFIEIQNNENRGRHVITKKFVPVGTLLIVEDPFAKILLNQYRWDVRHCHTCLGTISNGIPCGSCVFAVFCSPSCEASQDQYMCQISTHLHSLNPSRTLLLATKIITKIGPNKLYELFSSNNNNNNNNEDSKPKVKDIILEQGERQEEEDGFPLGFVNGVYDSSNYHTILNLIHHTATRSELFQYTVEAAAVTQALWSYSNFFESHRDLAFKTLVCKLLILHLQNLPPNAHSVNELVNVLDVEEYGAGAYSLLSLINHDCDPNVTRFNLPNGRVAVISIKAIESSSELLDNYGVHYATHEFEDRQKHLSEHYYFTCDCSACLYKWPLFRDLKQSQQNIFESYSDLMSNKIIRNSTKDIRSEIMLTNKKFDTIFTKVMEGEDINLAELIKCLEFFETNFNLPFFKFNESQETFKHYLNVTIKKYIML